MELPSLKQKRGLFKRKVTSFQKIVESISSDNINEFIEELQLRTKNLEVAFADFENIQDNIEMLDESSVEFEYRESIESIYYKAMSSANKWLASQTVNTVKSETSFQTNSLNPIVNLPPLNIPNFSGKYDEYLQFKDSFNALIESNQELSKVQKFYYLKSALKGEAADIILNLTITETNYDIAWQLITDRYENKRIIINTHIKALIDYPIIQKESATCLRNLINNFNRNYGALIKLDPILASSNTILVYLVTSKLDFNTKKSWESNSSAGDIPNIKNLITFIQNRCHVLETLYPNSQKYTDKVKSIANVSISFSCPLCKEKHFIYSCNKFKALDVKERFNKIKEFKLCTNCLRNNHTTGDCQASGCKICHKNHNTLLHFNNENKKSLLDTSSTTAVCNFNKSINETILSTASIYIKDGHNKWCKCRALLDSGSQSNFITENLFSKIKLEHEKINIPVIGINKSTNSINKITKTTIKSAHSNFKSEIVLLIIPQITENIPSTSFLKDNLAIPTNINLADPNFNISSTIDVLLGVGVFYDLLMKNQIHLGKSQPILQQTKLGWIVSGPLNTPYGHKTLTFHSNSTLQKELRAFWEIEELTTTIPKSKEHLTVEQHFKDTTRIGEDGRFIVKLPTRPSISELQSNEENAIKRFYALEKKLNQNQVLKEKYSDFIKEFIELKHMEKIPHHQINTDNSYYLPHHCVLKDSSLTTKLRVVFDASAKDSNGLSLNDTLIAGPNIQDDLLNILLRFRKYEIVFTADITKMYRQIKIDEEQQNLHRIVWRDDASQPLQHYKINRLTYGTSPASFIATRVLKELAMKHEDKYPQAANKITNDFYMDDLLSGANTKHEAEILIKQISNILKSGGFYLRKWLSNNRHIIINTFTSDETREKHFLIYEAKTKTLGIYWSAKDDLLEYTVDLSEQPQLTKRGILSRISKIFDPLGLITPITIKSKIFMQELWKLKTGWDNELPLSILTKWQDDLNQLKLVNTISIPRKIALSTPTKINIVGFCDASERAYGACLYLVSQDRQGNRMARLICAKSRVAPLKTISLPRLELCGALLLAKLTVNTINALNISIDNIYLFSDSTIVLSWIASEPSNLKTFVANRVSEIQTTLKDSVKWYHVRSNENPADLISRGTTVDSLINSKLWWHGPNWIFENSFQSVNIDDNLPELKSRPTTSLIIKTNTANIFWLDKFSTFSKLKRVTAYIFRFINNIKHKNKRTTGPLNITEINQATIFIIKAVQRETFDLDIKCILKNHDLPNSSKLLSLNPFLDNHNILRVGGRLANANLDFKSKHPIILAKNHFFTNLIINYHHIKLLHAGPRLTLSSIREEFWPLNGLNTVKRVLKSCIRCFRQNPKQQFPLMGPLPGLRVIPSRPFTNSGVDLAGPYQIKDGKLRNRAFVKVYIVLFICFSTKAIHIDLATDLSKEAFLNVLKRFISRRGLCANLYSDNGTNFIGANNELKRMYQGLKIAISNSSVQNYLLDNQIQWHFIPSRSPTFGGLWERAVRSIKSHLKRVLINTTLTYESFYTVLTQIEAILNSRPLCPLSEDPNDLTPLTPAHFLIGNTMLNIPHDEGNLQNNKLIKYNQLQQLTKHFWNRWNKEYLHTLQQRNKWHRNNTDITVGSLVVVREDGVPVMQWPMGRIVKLFPGDDGVVRVVEVQLRNGKVRRAVNKLCPLPMER